MHDTLDYFKEDPIFRKYHHEKITFTSVYMFHEKYMMPLSHDEVVHGKSSMIYKMPGDEWQKFANLRALYVFMFTNPGAKLLFMGAEFGQTNEWNFENSLNWELLNYPVHQGLQNLTKDLNQLYKTKSALYELQFSENGYEWISGDDRDNSVFIYLRKGKNNEVLMTILNLTPQSIDYQIGIEKESKWNVIFNSDDKVYHGSGTDAKILKYQDIECHNRENSIIIKLPPLSGIVLKKIN